MAVAVEFSGDEAKLIRSILKMEGGLERVERKLREVQQEGKRSGDSFEQAGRQGDKAFDVGKLKSFVGQLAGAAGVTGAVGTVVKAYQDWLAVTREIGRETAKATNDIIAFAALQAGGTKAQSVQQAAALAARFGITNRGEAFNTVQALQSVLGGDLQKGLKASESVFGATQVGIPLEFARELEVLGATQGQKPGEAVRRAFVAGQASARDPAVLARAASGLTFFGDDTLSGFASAAVIAGGVRPDELQTFVKAAGIGLSSTSALAQGTAAEPSLFTRLGVSGKDTITKLRALAAGGFTTPERLGEVGLKEIRQAQSIATLASNVEDVARIRQEIEAGATPGLFARQRGAVESELPVFETQRQIQQVQTLFQNEVLGQRGKEALSVELEDVIRGLALRRLGMETGLLGRTVDEEGRATPFQGVRAVLGGSAPIGGSPLAAVPAGVSALGEEMERIRQEISAGNAAIVAAIERNGRGGASLVPVMEDR
jgi:hypothetical protein